MILAITIGALMAAAVYLMLTPTFIRVVLGFVMLSHGVNLLLFSAGGSDRRDEPIGGDLDPGSVADALPQAFVLTAIVIAFAITMFMLSLAVTGRGGRANAEDPLETAATPPNRDVKDVTRFGFLPDGSPQDSSSELRESSQTAAGSDTTESTETSTEGEIR